MSVPVSAGQTATVQVTYSLAEQTVPAGVSLPEAVPLGELSDENNNPFGFNGQLATDVGDGSGVVVQSDVVLTAAHLVFNDQTLSYVSTANFFFREEAGYYEPEPLAARGWYILSGYAAQRTNDLIGGLAPDQSSPQSRNLDVAALYFTTPVAAAVTAVICPPTLTLMNGLPVRPTRCSPGIRSMGRNSLESIILFQGCCMKPARNGLPWPSTQIPSATSRFIQRPGS